MRRRWEWLSYLGLQACAEGDLFCFAPLFRFVLIATRVVLDGGTTKQRRPKLTALFYSFRGGRTILKAVCRSSFLDRHHSHSSSLFFGLFVHHLISLLLAFFSLYSSTLLSSSALLLILGRLIDVVLTFSPNPFFRVTTCDLRSSPLRRLSGNPRCPPSVHAIVSALADHNPLLITGFHRM